MVAGFFVRSGAKKVGRVRGWLLEFSAYQLFRLLRTHVRMQRMQSDAGEHVSAKASEQRYVKMEEVRLVQARRF